MTNDEKWVRERAAELLRRYEGGVHASTLQVLNEVIITFGKEAIERTRAEPPDLTWFWDAVDADGLADVPSDEVGALHRLRKLAARAEAAEAKLARLKDPDEALVEAAGEAVASVDGICPDFAECKGWPGCLCRYEAWIAIRAIAATLEETGESDGRV